MKRSIFDLPWQVRRFLAGYLKMKYQHADDLLMASMIHRVEFVPRNTCPLHEGGGTESSGGLRLLKSVRDRLTGRVFRILQCSVCGVGLTDPHPSEATAQYLYEGRSSFCNFEPIRKTAMDRLKNYFARGDIRRIHAAGGRPRIDSVLDFGTGNGRFAAASKAVFPDCQVDAADFDQEPPEELKSMPGVTYLSLKAFSQTSKKYDLILLRHVVEHIHDPIAFVRSMARRLSPEGILYIEVPHLDSASVRFFSSTANALFVPYHLFNFNKISLETLIRAAGLNGRITTKTLPFMGCALAGLLKQERNDLHQLLGILLHPVQLVIDGLFGKFILAAVCGAGKLEARPSQETKRSNPILSGFPEDLFEKSVSCCLCKTKGVSPEGAAGLSFLCEVQGSHAFSGQVFSVYRCDHCGVGVTFPQVAARHIPLLYKKNDVIPFADESGLISRVRLFFFRKEAKGWLKWLKKVEGMTRKDFFRVLDFGTGSGMNALAFAGVLGDGGGVCAADFSPDVPPGLSENKRVSYLSQELLESSGKKFDCIHMRHVLEHVPDPLAFLSRMRKLLSPKGVLFIEVPGLDPALQPFTIRYFPEFFQSGLPYHYYFFTPQSLTALLKQVGFSSECRRTDLPSVGRMLQARTGRLFEGPRYFPLFFLGVLLYPLQWLYGLASGGQPMVRVLARKLE